MSNLHRVTSALGAGTYPAHTLPKVQVASEQTGATRALLTMGQLEMNRVTASHPTAYGRDGVKDVSPLPKDILNAVGNLGSDQIADSNRDCWEPLCHAMVAKVAEAYLKAGLIDGQVLWFQGLRTGHKPIARKALAEMKRTMPRLSVVADSTIPDDFDKRQSLREGHDLFVRLQEEGAVLATFLLDNCSPFALNFKLSVQDQYHAMALASLLAAQFHFAKNSSLAEVGKSLGNYAALAGMAFASRSLVPAREVPWWGISRRLLSGLPQRGYGEVNNIILEAKEATKQALTDPNARAIEETIDLRKPLFLVYTVPVQPHDKKLWEQFSGEIRRWLGNVYPTATPIFACGNGTPDPRYPGSYWVQVSAFFPIPDVPKPIQAILSSEDLKRGKATAGKRVPTNGRTTPRESLASSRPLVLQERGNNHD